MSIYTYNDWSRKQLVIAAARVEVLLAREELVAYSPSDDDDTGLEDYYRDELLTASNLLHQLEELPASEFDYRMPWVDA